MTPRPYRMDQRETASAATRGRIIDAARELLATPDGVSGFSMDAIARHAGVARMTVYYQFKSKPALLEALFDDLAGRGLLNRLPAAYAQSDALVALDQLIAAFANFWASDRMVIRRIRALAVIDPEVGEAIQMREERRRLGLRRIVERLGERCGAATAGIRAEGVDAVFMLTSFETFDRLSGPDRTRKDVTRTIQRLARCALGVPVQEDG